MAEGSAIGGVMPADDGTGVPATSLLHLWSKEWKYASSFDCARSGLAAVLRQRGIRRAWLPAYSCTSLAEAVASADALVEFYGCDRELNIATDVLDRDLRSGDAFIGIDYFGRSIGSHLSRLRRKYPDVCWIEDRAQALSPGEPAWGDIVMYSARKLVGVADGGLLFSQRALPIPNGPERVDVWAPEIARAFDTKGYHASAWYPVFRSREAAFSPGDSRATKRTMSALSKIIAGPIANARRRNWQILAEKLESFALWPIVTASFAPLAFPIVTRDAVRMVAMLAERGIWAPRHWAQLPDGADAFKDAAWLSGHCVSLPLDQRYGRREMQRVANAVLEIERPSF